MVEGVNQAQSLIEELLRFGIAGGDRMMNVAHSRHKRCGLGLSVGGMVLSKRRQAQPQGEQKRDAKSHTNPPTVN